ncbi:MAG TPA: class II aldolase/adducin family protein [Acidimicrobiales bacterium]|nr:class II aldolase/adducin family protein [Acidimicrobiales bacterium]
MDRAEGTRLAEAKLSLALLGRSLEADGLAIGFSGNLSVRVGEVVAITPSAVAYDEIRPDDICLVSMDGRPLEPSNGRVLSSETPMHLAVYAATAAGAIVHTHSPEVVALSTVATELPAIHYAIVGLGGPVRVAPYVRFGSEGLAKAATEALDGRYAAILQNHGAITYGGSLEEAYQRARLLEWMARVYRLARSLGSPRILGRDELAEVAAERRRRQEAIAGVVRENVES